LCRKSGPGAAEIDRFVHPLEVWLLALRFWKVFEVPATAKYSPSSPGSDSAAGAGLPVNIRHDAIRRKEIFS